MSLKKKQIEVLTAQLEDERRKGLKKLGFLESSMRAQEASSRDGLYYSQHPAEMGTEANEREKNYRIATSESRYLYRVEEALEKIKDGGYGNCETCEGPIPYGRLQIVPTARVCVSCKEEQERLRFVGR